jgi:hypothetical protein
VLQIQDSKSDLLQTERRKFIEEQWTRGPWVRVCSFNKCLGDHISFYSALIPKKYEAQFFREVGWDLHSGDGYPAVWEGGGGGRKKFGYYPFGTDSGVEPLIIVRHFYNEWPAALEVSQEFRLYSNLYLNPKASVGDQQVFVRYNTNGDVEEVARINGLDAEIRLSAMLPFLAAKQMHLGLFFDAIAENTATLQELGFKNGEITERKGDLIYALSFGEGGISSSRQSFSRLIGKTLIRCPKRVTAAPYAGRKKENYCDFITGDDGRGNPIMHTCDPDKLANYFGKNPNAPHYLTPVHFRRDVLQKYYDNPRRYTVSDANISCGALWSMRIDNDHANRVVAWLGDLGRDLSEEERHHWKHYNVPPEGPLISRTSYLRNICGMFADPEMPDLTFKHEYPRLNDRWQKQFGWHLFLPLREEDKHVFDILRIPLSDNIAEFDDQVLALAKLLVDSLNEKQLAAELSGESKPDEKGIAKLERWFQEQSVTGYAEHIRFLRKLQALRAGSAHRKGDEYQKTADYFQIGKHDLPTVFRNILTLALSLLRFLNSKVSAASVKN